MRRTTQKEGEYEEFPGKETNPNHNEASRGPTQVVTKEEKNRRGLKKRL